MLKIIHDSVTLRYHRGKKEICTFTRTIHKIASLGVTVHGINLKKEREIWGKKRKENNYNVMNNIFLPQKMVMCFLKSEHIEIKLIKVTVVNKLTLDCSKQFIFEKEGCSRRKSRIIYM